MIKLIIAGGRDFTDYAFLREKVNFCLATVDVAVEIISGKAKGADTLGEKYAKERGLPIKEFPALWDTYGKAAGIYRNEDMAHYATHLIAFWNGKSRGTKHMIDTARRLNLEVRIFRY